MDDLSQRLAGILNDPESMEQFRKMAESLFSGGESSQSSKPDPEPVGMPQVEEIQAIISILSKLNCSKEDARTHLIMALKPYLSEQRQKKADTAIKLLKLLELLPLIKESGFLNL
ncbi:MAG: hypothetical protein ACOYJS_05355 [Acutalibacteraceae bacterium]|jgi:hypothetical protein